MKKIICISGLKRSGKDTSAKFIIDSLRDDGNSVNTFSFAYHIKMGLYKALNGIVDISFDDIDGKTDYNREECLEIPIYKFQLLLNTYLNYIDGIVYETNLYLGENGVKFDKNESKSLWLEIEPSYEIDDNIVISVRRLMQLFGTDIIGVQDYQIWSKITMFDIHTSNSEYNIITDLRLDYEIMGIEEIMNIYPDDFKWFKVIEIYRPDNISKIDHLSDIGISNKYKDFVIVNDGDLNQLKNRVLKIKNIL